MHFYFFSDSEVYVKKTFKIYIFIVKLRSIIEVDFLNLQIDLWNACTGTSLILIKLSSSSSLSDIACFFNHC